MAEERRNQRPSRDGSSRQDSSRRQEPGRNNGTRGNKAAGSTSGGGRDGGRDRGRDGARSGGSRPGGERGRGRDDRTSDSRPPKRDQATRSADQAAYDGPELPAEISGRELDHAVLAQLKSLPEKLANRVARHLAAAGSLIDEDPETAYQHAKAARVRAPRLAVVREAAGEAAYAAGHYADALADLRAAKRMNGATAYLPIMADCHRALGNPAQALKLAKSPSVANFASAAKAEMTIVEAGARRDLGQQDAALRTLELAPLQSKARESWVVRLRYAYADALAEAGRNQDAVAWFHRANAIDADEITDAARRAAELEKTLDV